MPALVSGSGPRVSALEFDVIFEDTVAFDKNISRYGIESGARAADHAIIEPITYNVRAAISDTPLNTFLLGVAAGALSNFADSGIAAGLAGHSSAALNDQDIAGEKFRQIKDLFVSKENVAIDAGHDILLNMQLKSFKRVRNAENESALIVDMEFQELATLATLKANQHRTVTNPDDPTSTQSANLIERGEQALRDAKESVTSKIDDLKGAIFG